MFAFDATSILAVVLCALATYALRLGGLLLASKMPMSGRFRRGMDTLPGALLFSLVVPSIAAEGAWGLLAAGLIALVSLRTRNTLAAMLLGMAVIFIQRRMGW